MRLRLILAIVLPISSTVFPPRVDSQSLFAIRPVRVFDGEQAVENQTVIVRDGLIWRIGGPELVVPPGADIIDGHGRTLLPGLVDAHVHLSDSMEADLRQAISLGVTTVLDMWSGSLRVGRIKAISTADPPGMASVLTAGTGATAPGGHPTQMGGPPTPTLDDSAQAGAFVDARIAEGADYIKIIYDDLVAFGRPVPMLDQRTLAGLIAAAHKRGKLAVVHIGTEAQAQAAIEAGADGLAHLFAAATVSPGFAPLVARHHAFVVPTLGVLYGFFCGKPDGNALVADSLLRPYIQPRWRAMMSTRPREARRSCAGTEEAIRQLSQDKVSILTGTDAPVPGQTYGASVHGELALLVDAGLTPTQALTAATSAPARRFGLRDRGFIRPGLRADLVLVDGDPMRDILATRRIVAVWKRGIPVVRIRYEE